MTSLHNVIRIWQNITWLILCSSFVTTILGKLRVLKNLQRQPENMQETLRFFSRIWMTLDPKKLGNMFWGLWHLGKYLQVQWSQGDPMQYCPLHGILAGYLGGEGFYLILWFFFLGQTNSLFCPCHCWFCSACVYSLIYHFNPYLGTSVMRWCPCCRTEAHSPCLLAVLPQGQRTDLTIEGKRETAVNKLKSIWTIAFSGSPPFVEMVQQQTGILPEPGLCLLFPHESSN